MAGVVDLCSVLIQVSIRTMTIPQLYIPCLLVPDVALRHSGEPESESDVSRSIGRVRFVSKEWLVHPAAL